MCVERKNVHDRCEALLGKLSHPATPYWVVELVAILSDLELALHAIESAKDDSAGCIALLAARVTSLETRYSELLYRMSER